MAGVGAGNFGSMKKLAWKPVAVYTAIAQLNAGASAWNLRGAGFTFTWEGLKMGGGYLSAENANASRAGVGAGPMPGYPETGGAEKMPAVQASMLKVSSLLSTVESKIDQLHGRLRPVMRERVPAPGAAEKNVPAVVPLCLDLDLLAGRLERMIDSLSAIDSNLEV